MRGAGLEVGDAAFDVNRFQKGDNGQLKGNKRNLEAGRVCATPAKRLAIAALQIAAAS